MRHLPESWLRTARRVHAHDDVAGTGAALLLRYAEPHRHYHDLAHLDEVLRSVDELAHCARDADTVRLAAWYHDAVYDPTASDNEERSARLAESELAKLRVSGSVVEEVARLVRVTATHEVDPGDDNAAVLCDSDLAVLAAETGRYQRYADGVRQEYGHLDDATFAAGRAAVLRQLLDRPALFSTPDGRAAWEAAARANVVVELAQLEA